MRKWTGQDSRQDPSPQSQPRLGWQGQEWGLCKEGRGQAWTECTGKESGRCRAVGAGAPAWVGTVLLGVLVRPPMLARQGLCSALMVSGLRIHGSHREKALGVLVASALGSNPRPPSGQP